MSDEIKDQAKAFAKTAQDAMKSTTLNRLTMTVTRNGIDIATIHDKPKAEPAKVEPAPE